MIVFKGAKIQKNYKENIGSSLKDKETLNERYCN